MASTVLLVSRDPPSTALMDQLESRGLCVEATSSRRFERTFEVVGPDLVVHVGWTGSTEVVGSLMRRGPQRPLVLVVDRDRLLQARDLDRKVVASVLVSDMSVGRLAERIAKLASSAGQESSREAAQPPRRLALVDDDVTRADAVARALRERGLDVQLTPGDPKATRWALLRRFEPELFVAPGEGRLPETWLALQRADAQLGHVPLRTVPYSRVFDETSGAVRLDVLLRRIGMAEGVPGSEGMVEPSAGVPEEGEATRAARASGVDGDFDDERPTLLIGDIVPDSLDEAGERPTLALQDDDERPTVIVDEDDERPTVIVDEDDDRPTLAIDETVAPEPAGHGEPRGGSRSKRRVVSLLAVVLGIASLAAGGWWWRSQGARRPEVSPARPPTDGIAAPPLPRPPGEPGAPPATQLAEVPGSPPASPWEVPENPTATSCESLLDPAEALPRGDVAQASRYWEKARAALVLGDIPKAQGWMCRAVFVFPKSLAAEGLAESYLDMGAPREAKRWIDVALEHRPDRSRTVELLGDIENQLGDVEASRSSWLRAFQIHADDARIHDEEDPTLALLARDQMKKGEAALRAGDLGRAEIHYRRAAVFRPDSEEAPLGLARVASAAEKSDRAALWVKEALRRNPDSAEARQLERDADQR